MNLLTALHGSAEAKPGTEKKVAGGVLAWARVGVAGLLGKVSKSNGSAPADSPRFDIPTPPPRAKDGVDKTQKIPSPKEHSELVEKTIEAALIPATSMAEAVDVTNIQGIVGDSTKKGGQGTVFVGEKYTGKFAHGVPLMPAERLSADPETWRVVVSTTDESLERLKNEAAAMRDIEADSRHHNFPKLVNTQLYKTGDESSAQYMPGLVMTTIENYITDEELALFLRKDVPVQLFIDDLALELIHAYRLSQVQVMYEGEKVPFCHRDIAKKNGGWGINPRTKKMSRWSMDAGLARSRKGVSITGQMQGSPRWMSKTQTKEFDMKLLNPVHDFISRLYLLLDTYLQSSVRHDEQGEALFWRFNQIENIRDLPALMERANFPIELRELYAGIQSVDYSAAIMTEKQQKFIDGVCETVFGMSSFNIPGQSFKKAVADAEELGFAFRCPEEGEKNSDWVQALNEHYRTAPELNEHNRGIIEWRPETPTMGTGTRVALSTAAVAAAVAALFAAGVFNKKPEQKPDAAANVKAAPKIVTTLFANEGNVPNVTVERDAEGDFQGETLFKGTQNEISFNTENTPFRRKSTGEIDLGFPRMSAAQMAKFFGIDEQTLIDRIMSKGPDFASAAVELKNGGVKDVAMYYSSDGRQVRFIGGGVGIYIISDDDGKFSVFGLDISGTKNPELIGRSPSHLDAKQHPNTGPVVHGVDPDDDTAVIINSKKKFGGQSPINFGKQGKWMTDNYVPNMQRDIPKVSPITTFTELNEKFPATVTTNLLASTFVSSTNVPPATAINVSESMDVPLGPVVLSPQLRDWVKNLGHINIIQRDFDVVTIAREVPIIPLRPKEEIVSETTPPSVANNVATVVPPTTANEDTVPLDPRVEDILPNDAPTPFVIPPQSTNSAPILKAPTTNAPASTLNKITNAVSSVTNRFKSFFGAKEASTTNAPSEAEVKAGFEKARLSFTNSVINAAPKGYTPVLKGGTNDVAQNPVVPKKEEEPVER